jgi:hypothetical protein
VPRIIVTVDPVSSELNHQTPVLFDEQVHSVHLSTDHAAAQLVERLAWAIKDAESTEGRRPDRRMWQGRPAKSRTGVPRARAPRAISA